MLHIDSYVYKCDQKYFSVTDASEGSSGSDAETMQRKSSVGWMDSKKF